MIKLSSVVFSFNGLAIFAYLGLISVVLNAIGYGRYIDTVVSVFLGCFMAIAIGWIKVFRLKDFLISATIVSIIFLFIRAVF